MDISPADYADLRRTLNGVINRMAQKRSAPFSLSEREEMIDVGLSVAVEMLPGWAPYGQASLGGFVVNAAARAMCKALRDEADPTTQCDNSRLKQQHERDEAEAARDAGRDATQAAPAPVKAGVEVLELVAGSDVTGGIEMASWQRAVRARLEDLSAGNVAVQMVIEVTAHGADADEVSARHGFSPTQGKRQRSLGLARLRGDRVLRALAAELTGRGADLAQDVERDIKPENVIHAPAATEAGPAAEAVAAASTDAPPAPAPAALVVSKVYVVTAPPAQLPWRPSWMIEYRPVSSLALAFPRRVPATALAGRGVEMPAASLPRSEVAARCRARGSPGAQLALQ